MSVAPVSSAGGGAVLKGSYTEDGQLREDGQSSGALLPSRFSEFPFHGRGDGF